MNKKILIIIACIFTLLLCGCKCNKCSKATIESIKKDYPYFDVTLNINNESYQIIKSKNGYLYNNKENDALIYYDFNNKTYYEINDNNKTKTVLNENYNLDVYVNNIYYVLSYFVEKETKKGYEIEQNSYLDYDVNIYKKQSLNYSEEIIVVKKENICLGFNITTNEKTINAKIEKLSFNETDLSKYENYNIISNESEYIKNNFNNYNIEIYLNGNEYKLIKSSDGYYYENLAENVCIYYNKETSSYYTIDNKTKTKTLISGEFSMNTYFDNTFYVLLYHLDKKLLIDYNKEEGTYLDRDITKYTYKGSYQESIIIDNETRACLLFELKTNEIDVVGKVKNVMFEDTDLNYFSDYQTLKKCEDLTLKTKEEIVDQFTDYSVVLKQGKNTIKMIKTNNGFVCIIDDGENNSGVLFDKTNDIWYDISTISKEKSVTSNLYTIEEYEENVFSLLTDYTKYVNDKFYMLDKQKYLDRDVTIYTRNIALKDTLYKQEFIIDDVTGACLKQDININGLTTSFYVEELIFKGNIDEYLNYNDVYFSWPKDHKYLEDIQKIEYGTLVRGFEDEDGLNLYYESINNSFFNQILKDIKAAGFINEVEQNYALGDDQLYIYYIYSALNDKGLNIKLEFDGDNKTLLIIINETIR